MRGSCNRAWRDGTAFRIERYGVPGREPDAAPPDDAGDDDEAGAETGALRGSEVAGTLRCTGSLRAGSRYTGALCWAGSLRGDDGA